MLKRKIVEQETVTDKTTLGLWVNGWYVNCDGIWRQWPHYVLYGADVNDKK